MATKYVSALDGGQMDSALMDMATHTSEAWAVGTRNGQAVSASDVTYHNNAKYYSDKVSTDTQRAEDAAARAEAAVPAGTAGAVFFDRAQSLTTAQQMQAKANISAGGTNPNLLDNPWWGSGEIVNQRGATSGQTTNGTYSIDRWKMSYGSTVGTWSLGTSGLTITAASGTYALFQQVIPSSVRDYLVGKTVTGSIMFSDGTIHSGSVVWGSGAGTRTMWANPNNDIYIAEVEGTHFRVLIAHGTSFTIRAMKLELGSVSTLANDAPPDYGTELAKCQRYFVRLKYTDTGKQVGFGYMYNTTQARILIPTPVTMRVAPTVTTTNLGGAFRVNAGGTYLTPSSTSATATALPNGVNINFGTSSAGTSGAIATVFSYGEGSIDLSADL